MKESEEIVAGREYIFTKSGNRVRTVAFEAEQWIVERTYGRSAGKQMLVDARSLAPVPVCDEGEPEAAEEAASK